VDSGSKVEIGIGSMGDRKGTFWWVAIGLAVAVFLYVLYIGLRKHLEGSGDG